MNESLSHIECLLPMKLGAAHLIGSSFNGSILTLSLSHNWVCTQTELSKRSPKIGHPPAHNYDPTGSEVEQSIKSEKAPHSVLGN